MKRILVLFAVLLLFPLNLFAQASEIPDWIRNNAKWWSASQISDKDFVKGIEYLAQTGIIKIPPSTANSESSSIPSWLRNNAGWWSQGLLSDDEFVKGIQYLVTRGVINVSESKISCLGNGLCIYERVQRIVDGDTIYIEGYKIRLSLTNTPESYEPGFLQATEFTKKLCPVSSIITVDQDDRQLFDAYGRLLGKVYCGDKVLNSELLDNGHASILTKYCSTSEFSDESWAQKYGCKLQESKPIKETPQPIKETPQPIKETPQPQNRENCDASYPDVCIPPYPPDLDCKDIPFKKFRVLPPDPHRFDGDKDGIGCES